MSKGVGEQLRQLLVIDEAYYVLNSPLVIRCGACFPGHDCRAPNLHQQPKHV
ncbi:hypothetical protein [Vulcanisaeta sp. JCM 16161]|uniref:hypothetical protein n=1 Tax=Vulcanisaeta sp. JCM 16161 TaxID=1295372 RepID=UPI00406C2A7F